MAIREYFYFLLVLSVALFGLVASQAESSPFEANAADQGGQLPLHVPAVVKAVEHPDEEQPRMRVNYQYEINNTIKEFPEFNPKDFPSGPIRFDRTEVFSDLPVASSGRWLHSAVVVGNKMWVYGGISAYSDKLYNDVWTFDYRLTQWNQLQRSYVPPFPPGGGRPKDVPLPPSFKDMPKEHALRRPPVPVYELPYNTIHEGVGVAHESAVARSEFGATDDESSGDDESFFLELGTDVRYPSPGNVPVNANGQVTDPRVSYMYPPFSAGQAAAQANYAYANPVTNGHPAVNAAVRNPGSVYPSLFNNQPQSAMNTQNMYPYPANQPTPAASTQQQRQAQSMNAHFKKAYAAGAQAAASAAHMETKYGFVPPGAADPNAQKNVNGNPGVLDWRSLIGLRPENDGVRDWPGMPTDLWEYNIDTKIWKCVLPQAEDGVYPAAAPVTRWLHSSVSIADRMIVFGGASNEKKIMGDLWIFDPSSQVWTEAHPRAGSKRPLPREGHCATSAGSMMYIFGGVSYGYQPFNDVWAYNTITNEWTELQPNNPYKGIVPRWLSSCTAVEDGPNQVRLFVFGGVSGDYVPMNDLSIFNLEDNTWSEAPVLSGFAPFPRMMHNMIWLGSRLYVFGGMANNIAFDDMHYYDLEKQQWSETLTYGAFPFARGGASACKVTPPKSQIPDRPDYQPFEIASRPNLRWSPRYRKVWNDNQFMIVFGGAGVVQV